MSARRSNVSQQHRLRVEIIDHQIKPAIAIEVANRQATPGPRIRQRASRRRAYAFELALHVAEEQRLLCVTRSPLMRIGRRINMPVYYKQVEPAVVVVIDKARGPTKKRNRNFT